MLRITMKLGLLLVALATSVPSAAGQSSTISYAQKLVDMSLAADRHLMVLSIHAIAPGSSNYSIVASNAPRLLGKESDAAALHIIRDNATTVMSAKPEGAFEVFVPMYDVTGATIGALGLKYRYPFPDRQAALEAAIKLRDELRNVIPNSQTLFDRFSYYASTGDNLAAQLLSKEVVRHPDLWVLAFHCTPPGDTVNRLIAINYVKLTGKQSEESEEVLSKNGNTALEVWPLTHRVETHVPMFDQQGALIGTLATVYFYQDYAFDLPEILGRTIAVRDEVMRETPSLAALVATPSSH